MKPQSVLVFTLCVLGAFAQDGPLGSVRDAFHIYSECKQSDGLVPCLKMKALTLVDRIARMDSVTLIDGVELKGKTEEVPNQPTPEEIEKTLPRSLDAKSDALSTVIIDRIARMIGSKSIEISVPKLVETARKGDSEKFGDIDDLFGGEGGHGGGHGGGLGGGLGGGKKKRKEKGGKKGGFGMQQFLMQIIAKKIAMIPLFIGGLFFLSLKALADAKVALLIAGIIFAKKLIASKQAGGAGAGVQHVSAGWSSGGGSSGWNGGWNSGGSGGWDRRSIEEAQSMAYKAQKQQ
ncbi:uncharacterized protein LOC143200179 [Rhynchophorus ferrugineus]|uniref:uncharacterized protein LOC143200179 n=1 Tax=Rhynchophorus ferrugineus TaxID=354439 RepID=UPI003FCD33A7